MRFPLCLQILCLIGATTLSAGAAAANECMNLWVERNAIFDRKGYCFSTALGKGYFDNSNCYTKSPALSSSESKRIAQIKAREKRLGCASQKSRWTVSALRNRNSSGSSGGSGSTGGGGFANSPLGRALTEMNQMADQGARIRGTYQCQFRCERLGGQEAKLSITLRDVNSYQAYDYVNMNGSRICDDSFGGAWSMPTFFPGIDCRLSY